MSIQHPSLSRRSLIGGAAAVGAAAAASTPAEAQAVGAATPPEGFEPVRLPGRVVKVEKGGAFADMMQPNQLWPKAEVAKQMVETALTTLTGAGTLSEALAKFIHRSDVVAIKVNGIAGQNGATMAVNYEVVAPLVDGLIAMGVPADKITVYEQFPSYMRGTRIGIKGNKLPAGVTLGIHGNSDAAMKAIKVFESVETKYVRFLTEATAVIDCTMMKDHSICGFTGALKNMTHGSIINPQDHHAHHASPQIAQLYAHEILRSRVRLHLTDAFKIIYDQGPLDKNPKRRIPHGAIYAATDPVALDTVGWEVIDRARTENGLKTLEAAKRKPKYIARAADLGLGEHDSSKITLKSVSV